MERKYIAIDLKSFYASVECVERGLSPLTTFLVVADPGRTEKTICLAVSPALKSYGIPGRARLYEVVQKVAEINRVRERNWRRQMGRRGQKWPDGESYDDAELKRNLGLRLDYIVAPPQMTQYMRYSTKIYGTYLKFVAPEDIFAYSIDEVFVDATPYLRLYGGSAAEMARRMIRAVLDETGITATAGVGTNMYLAKVAMDIVAKHAEPDESGVRLAELDEMSYRRKLWAHQPLTDFWRVGRGYAKRLMAAGLYTMGDIARCSERDEEYLYRRFGVNAELLIDHAWGWEPCEMRDVKAYRPRSHELSSGQVLKEPYDFARARVIVEEMANEAAMELLEKDLVAGFVTLTVGYDRTSLARYSGEVAKDHYGRMVPKHAHGTERLGEATASVTLIREAVLRLFDRLVKRDLLVRRVTIGLGEVVQASQRTTSQTLRQLKLFDWRGEATSGEAQTHERFEKERRANAAILAIKRRYGKNAILRGVNFEEGATGRERNAQIGGHRA